MYHAPEGDKSITVLAIFTFIILVMCVIWKVQH